MTGWPGVAVITPTWQRHDLLLHRAMPSVAEQDYPGPIAHIVVSDGPDPVLAGRWDDLDRTAPAAAGSRTRWLILLDSHDPAARWGHRARLAGITIARNAGIDLFAWLDDDNAYRPQHLRRMVETLQAHPAAGLVYSRITMHTVAGEYLVGLAPPSYGQIDTSAMMTTAAAHEVATWRDDGQETIDWDLAERMMAGGVTWAHLHEITADYYFGGTGPQP